MAHFFKKIQNSIKLFLQKRSTVIAFQVFFHNDGFCLSIHPCDCLRSLSCLSFVLILMNFIQIFAMGHSCQHGTDEKEVGGATFKKIESLCLKRSRFLVQKLSYFCPFKMTRKLSLCNFRPKLQQSYGGQHSSGDLTVSIILLSRVRISSTPITL